MTAVDLTPSMAAALREVIRRPGNFATAYPGGWKSIRALERRDLIRVDRANTYGVEAEAVFPTQYGFRTAHDLMRRAS